MNLIQILADNLKNEIPLNKGICIKIKKNFTGDVLKFMKNYLPENETSAFYVHKNNKNFKDLFKIDEILIEKNDEEYKFGKFNLKNKNLICVDKAHFNCKGKRIK